MWKISYLKVYKLPENFWIFRKLWLPNIFWYFIKSNFSKIYFKKHASKLLFSGNQNHHKISWSFSKEYQLKLNHIQHFWSLNILLIGCKNLTINRWLIASSICWLVAVYKSLTRAHHEVILRFGWNRFNDLIRRTFHANYFHV